MFEFLNPLFLIGLASAAIPLLIHLSRSRRTKKIQFSTTRFLTDHFLRSYRMSRLKELLLLACRMALCALFAMALARPMFLPRGDKFNLGQSRSLVFVLDNSASMSYEEEGKTLFARAQTAARELLDGLKSGDTAAVVLAGRRAQGPESLFPEPTAELGDVRQAINRSEPAVLGTDLSAAVARAEELLRASPAQSKEIYVLSDLQESGWEVGEAKNDATGKLGALVFFVSVRPKEEVENLSITAVQYAASRPMVGVPFVIRPHIRNQSETVRSCSVRLYVDGKKVGEQQIDKLQAERWVVPRFHHTFDLGGWHNGYVEVDDPNLPADNRRYFTFKVVDSVNALAVNGAPSSVNRLDELFFLKTALTAAVEGKSPIRVDAVSTAGLADKALGEYPLVIVANVDRLPLPVVEKLEHYVDAGGSLWVFLGDKANPAFFNEELAAPARLHGGLLPCRLNKIEGNPAGAQDFAYIGDVSADHAALAAFADAGFANLQGVTFKAYWGLEPPESGILMRSNHGAPLLCEKAFGKGHTLVFASTCDRDWTNFPVRPAFLPWVYRLTAYLAQEPLSGQGFAVTGERVALPVSLGTAQIVVKKPDDTSSYVAPNPDASQATFLDDTVQPGVYSIASARGSETGGSETRGKNDEERFAVNLESFESDLRYLDDFFAEESAENAKSDREERVRTGFAGLLPENPLVTFVPDANRVGEASLVARRGFKLWDLFLAVVLGFALFEPWFANRISMRMYLRSNENAPSPAPKTRRMERWLRRWLPQRMNS